jgi:myo-inositol-1(or 4)-monophosphatase
LTTQPSAAALNLTTLLDLAVRAARTGGAEITRRAGNATGVRYKSTATDPVSDADRASEAAVIGLITSERPGDGLLGEEGAGRPSTTGLRWVIDPLDGTVNYLYGLPHTTVSVACERACPGKCGDHCRDGWHPIVGAVYDPARDEMFSAAHGKGALLNGRPITAGAPRELSQALIATGFAYSASSRTRQAAMVAELIPLARDIRSHGSAALELCWVAAGRCDGFYEDELARWDWAAGALIAREAGALVSALGTGVVTAGPGVYQQLTAILDRRGPN